MHLILSFKNQAWVIHLYSTILIELNNINIFLLLDAVSISFTVFMFGTTKVVMLEDSSMSTMTCKFLTTYTIWYDNINISKIVITIN